MLLCKRNSAPIERYLKHDRVIHCAVCLQEIKTQEYYRCAAPCGRKGSGQCCVDCWKAVQYKTKCIVCNTHIRDQKLQVDLDVERSLIERHDERFHSYLKQLPADRLSEFAVRVLELYPGHTPFVCSHVLIRLDLAINYNEDSRKCHSFPLFETLDKHMCDAVKLWILKHGTAWWINLLVFVAKDDFDTFLLFDEWGTKHELEKAHPDAVDRRNRLLEYGVHYLHWNIGECAIILNMLTRYLQLDLPSLLAKFLVNPDWSTIGRDLAEEIVERAHPESELGKKLEQALQTAFTPAANMGEETCKVFFGWYSTYCKRLPPGIYKYKGLAVTMSLSDPSGIFWLHDKQLKQWVEEKWVDLNAPFKTQVSEETPFYVVIISPHAPDADFWRFIDRYDVHQDYLRISSKINGPEFYLSDIGHPFKDNLWTQLIFRKPTHVISVCNIRSIEWEVLKNQIKRKIELV